MAKTKPSSDFFDLTGGAKQFIEDTATKQNNDVEKTDKLSDKRTPTGKKAKETAATQLVNIKLPLDIHKRLKYETVVRSEEKATMSTIIVEALEDYFKKHPL